MFNSISALNTINECDSVIALAQTRKSTLVGRKTILQVRIDASAVNNVELEAEYDSVVAAHTSLTEQVANMPDGPIKQGKMIEIADYYHKKLLLEQRIQNRGPVSLVEQEWSMVKLDQEIATIDTLIAEAEAHKTTLPA